MIVARKIRKWWLYVSNSWRYYSYCVVFVSILKIKEKRKTLYFYFSVLTVASLLYLLNNIIFKEITAGLLHHFLKCYFNDVLAPIWVLSYSNILLRKKKIAMVRLSEILSFTFCCGLIWEYFAPLVKESAVTDIWDLFAYIWGGIIFWFLQKIYLKGTDKI